MTTTSTIPESQSVSVRTKQIGDTLLVIESAASTDARRLGMNPPVRQLSDAPCLWRDTTVTHILSRMEYIGHTVNFKTYRKSYKNKKQMHNDPSQWQIFKNTHEAIVDEKLLKIFSKTNQRSKLM